MTVSWERTGGRLAEDLPIWVMAAAAVMGVLGLLVLTDTERDWRFYFANAIMHIPLAIGWLYLCRKNNLERRFHVLWSPYFAFAMAWVFSTVVMSTVSHEGPVGVLRQSETFWYAIAYGSLFIFYKLESARPLWYFMIILGLFWTLQTLMLGFQAAGIEWTIEGPPTFQDYFENSDRFWDSWGWLIADLLVDIPISIAAVYFSVWRVITFARSRGDEAPMSNCKR